MLSSIPNAPAYFSLFVVSVMFVMFIRETYPTEVVALAGAATLLATGVLPADDFLQVFSNPAPWTIAAMFIISGGLVRTGALNKLTEIAGEYSKKHPKRVLFGFAIVTVLASAFMNNTPVVVLMIPITVQLAKSMGIASSKLLIPVSYVAILGGICTLIGTSTNLLVDGVAQSNGLAPFTMFEVTPLGIILVLYGFLYLRFVAPRLLPDRTSMADLIGGGSKKKFATELLIPKNSSLIGQNVFEVNIFKYQGVRVIDVVRKDHSLRAKFPDVDLKAGDRVVLRTAMEELLSLKESDDVRIANQVSTTETSTVEVLITPGCAMVGKTLGELHLRRRFGVYTLAVHRRDQNLASQLDNVRIRVGDTLLMEGEAAEIGEMASELDLVNVVEPTARPYRRRLAPIVIAVLSGVVILSALGVAPLYVLALFGVVIILLTHVLDAEEAFSLIDGHLMALIFAMLAIGTALDRSGAVKLIADALAPYLQGLPPFFIVWAIFLITSTLTEMISNNAVAVVVTPVAIGIANSIGIDPRPLVIAVMVAASASFATPIGYQTNTLVYGPGGYKFSDFVKVGLPLNITIGLLTSALIPFFWPF